MAQKVADRLVWAVEVLDIKPDDVLLEIGCGAGITVQLICERLTSGKIVAVDQSPAMIQTARKRNSVCITAGKADLHCVALSEIAIEDLQFDKIFAVNVNVFWQKPEKELALITKLLKPDGRAYFFFQPPTSAKVPEITAKLKHNLQQGGLIAVYEQVKDLNPASALVIIAQPL